MLYDHLGAPPCATGDDSCYNMWIGKRQHTQLATDVLLELTSSKKGGVGSCISVKVLGKTQRSCDELSARRFTRMYAHGVLRGREPWQDA